MTVRDVNYVSAELQDQTGLILFRTRPYDGPGSYRLSQRLTPNFLNGCQVESVETALHQRPILQRPYHYSVFYEQREHRLTFRPRLYSDHHLNSWPIHRYRWLIKNVWTLLATVVAILYDLTLSMCHRKCEGRGEPSSRRTIQACTSEDLTTLPTSSS